MGNSPVRILFVEAVALDETAAYVFSEYRPAVVSAVGIGPPFVASVGSQPLPERCPRPSAVSDSPDPRDVPVANRVDGEGRVWDEKHVDATAWPVETPHRCRRDDTGRRSSRANGRRPGRHLPVSTADYRTELLKAGSLCVPMENACSGLVCLSHRVSERQQLATKRGLTSSPR